MKYRLRSGHSQALLTGIEEPVRTIFGAFGGAALQAENEESMNARYAYSFDGENFQGNYATRQEAATAGFARAARFDSPVTSIFVGARIDGDDQSKGHAPAVVKQMQRAAARDNDEQGDDYLGHLSAEQMKDLDGVIAVAIRDWLVRHELRPTWFRVEGITEHSLPSNGAAALTREPGSEVAPGIGQHYSQY